MNTIIRAVCLLLLASRSLWAADAVTPSGDPRLDALKAELAMLEVKADIAAKRAALEEARFGKAATPMEGSITDPGNFKAFGQWAMSGAYQQVGDIAAKMATANAAACSTGILVTSDGDRHAAFVSANTVSTKLTEFTRALASVAPPAPARGQPAAMLPLAAIAGLIGAADTIVGFFRSNYTLADASLTPDDLAARVSSAAAIRAKLDKPVRIAGIDQRPTPGSLVTGVYKIFIAALSKARDRYAGAEVSATTDAKKVELARYKVILDEAAAYDKALTTPADGAVPLTIADTAMEDAGLCKLFVKFVGASTTLMTRKHLLSRNDGISAITGGTVMMVMMDPLGNAIDIKRITLDLRIGGSLTDLEKTVVPISTHADVSSGRVPKEATP